MDDGFSEGCKVRCINSGEFKDCSSKKALEEGQTYSVKRVGNELLHFNEIKGGWYKGRFEKVDQDFEVGDRVRVTKNSYELDNNLAWCVDEGYEDKITDFSEDSYGKWAVLSNTSQTVPLDYLELISKGEDTMDNVDAIAVEIDDTDMLEAIISKAKHKYDFTEHAIIEPKDDYVVFSDNKKFWGSCSISGSGAKGLGKLTENWNEIVDCLEQANKQEPPSLNGHRAKVKVEDDGHTSIDYHVTVGCWEGSLVDLIEFKRRCENIGVIDSVKVETGQGKSSVDVNELFEFIEDLQDYIDNQ
jgi:hypothetical protein